MPGLPPVVATLLADTRQYSASLAKAGAQMDALGKSGDTFGSKMAGVWGKLSTVAIAGAAGIGAVSVDLAFKYQDALDLMQRSTHLTGAEMEYLKGEILKISQATATSATDITSGYTQLIKSGESLHQANIDVAASAKFAAAFNTNLNDTLVSAIGIQKQHIAGTRSISQTLDIFATAIKHSQLTADTLNSALGGRALSAFAAYGIDLKTATTILAGFADQNLVGSRSTLVLKTGIAALEKPATDSKGKLTTQAKAVASLGLNMSVLAQEVRKPGGMLSVLQQLSTAFDRNASSAQKAQGIAAFMQQIFGTSAGPAFTNLITRLPQLTKLFDQLQHPGGAVTTSFAEWLKSPQGAFQNFKNTLENTAIKLGDVLLPKLTVGLIDATKLITQVFSSPVETHLLEGGLAVVLGAAITTKLVGVVLKALSAVGIEWTAAGEATSIGAAATRGGLVGGTLIASFLATTEALRHNFLGLGNAAEWAAGILGAYRGSPGTTDYAGNLAKALAKYGINNNATVALSPATIRYIEGLRPPGHGHRRPTHVKVTTRHRVKFG